MKNIDELHSEELVGKISSAVISHFFPINDESLTAAEIRQRSDLCGVVMGRIISVLVAQCLNQPDFAEEVERAEEIMKQQIFNQISSVIRPGGTAFQVIQGQRDE